MGKLQEGEDFYYNENGYLVFTEKYHLQRGYCCGNGCIHCPFDQVNVPDALKQAAMQSSPGEHQSGGNES